MITRQEYSQGRVGSMIDEQTAKLPTDTFMYAALGSILGSLALQAAGKREIANFVGQWAPTFLILGVYNKISKLHGQEF